MLLMTTNHITIDNMKNIDPNSWLYSVLQGLEQACRAIRQLSADEISIAEVDLGICCDALKERKSELSNYAQFINH